MPDLIAQGVQSQHRWRRPAPMGQVIVLGRGSGAWSVPWDDQISRQHVELVCSDGKARVRRLPTASNPIFVNGQSVESFSMQAGDHFVVGTTTFSLVDEQIQVSSDEPRPVTEQTFSPEYLRQVAFRNADQRIQVLSRLPEIIGGASTDSELFARLVNVLLSGVSRAGAAAIVRVDDDFSGTQSRILHWDRRITPHREFRPSEKLIRQALGQRESVVHVWNRKSNPGAAKFTASENVDWAYATPVSGDACRDWVLYIAGSFDAVVTADARVSDPLDLRDDVKFTELAATTLGSLLDVRRLAGLAQFLSPIVLEALAGKDPEVVLAPRETNVSVLFCDLRGFSQQSEQQADDLLGLLERVSQAMGVMTQEILQQGGVVGDFHGDAAMGFWGWPFPQEDAILRACTTALTIRAEFELAARQAGHPLADFRIGLGLATGRAVAGKLGSIDQVKVSVFGPVVNLASRLENMTKTLRVGILLDQCTAAYVRKHVSKNVARVRRLAVVRPYGMQQGVEVSELLPPEEDFPQLTDQNIEDYEAAVESFLQGDWPAALEQLHRVPAIDRAKDFLTVYIAQQNRVPPENWDGVIPLMSK